MEPIKTRGFTDPAKVNAETAAIKLAETQTDKVLSAYSQRPDTFGGRYIAADTFKELMPGYRESRASRNALNGAVHNSAAVLASEQYRRMVEQGPRPGRDTVVFVTGVPGAGKSSSVASAVEGTAGLVFEGQLSRPEPAMQKIEHALEKGFKVEIVAVHVAPEVALERTNTRYLDRDNGRGASINVMSDIQGNLPAGLRQIEERFGQNVSLTVLDNNPGRQQFSNGWGAIPTLEKEGNREHIHERLTTALESGYRDGRYSAGFYTQAAGREPARGLAPSARQEDGRGLEKDGNRPGISQANSKANALSPYAQGRQQNTDTPKPPSLKQNGPAQQGTDPVQDKRGRGR